MNPLRYQLAKALAILALLTTPACDRIFDKGEKENITVAEKKVAAGDFRGAVQYYEAALDGTAKTADVHHRLALIYADKLQSPLDTVHHLDRYLELVPTGSKTREAKALKKEAEAKVINRFSNGSPLTQAEAVRLKNENQMLTQKLNAILAQKPPAPTATLGKGEPARKPIPQGARTYTVQPGDTLAKISRTFYKNSSRARDIQDANFTQAAGTVKIKPGMVLVIPK